MRRDVAAILSIWTVGDAIDYMRSESVLPANSYDLVVVGPVHKPLGMVPLSQLLQTKRPIKIVDIMNKEMKRRSRFAKVVLLYRLKSGAETGIWFAR
jgi:magnesium transporter